MEARGSPRHLIIDARLARPAEGGADAAILAWEPLATHIIAIVGEGGFASLYARSVFLAASTFPWLAASARSPPAPQRFADLKINLAGHPPAEARAANRLLLITFTDILASLIGEPLTTRILQSAWGSDAAPDANQGSQP